MSLTRWSEALRSNERQRGIAAARLISWVTRKVGSQRIPNVGWSSRSESVLRMVAPCGVVSITIQYGGGGEVGDAEVVEAIWTERRSSVGLTSEPKR